MQHVDTFEAFFNLERLLPSKSTELDEEFDFLVELAKQMITNMPSRNEREKATAWITKLSSIRDTSEWELRNDYMKLLMYALQRPKLDGPFATYPDDEIMLRPFPENRTLMQMAKEMAKTRTGPCSGEGPPVAAEASSDLKTYTAAQEIPDFGVHCFFAISSEEPLPMWINGKNSFFPVQMDKRPDNASSVQYPCKSSRNRKYKKGARESQSTVRTTTAIASLRGIKSIDTVGDQQHVNVSLSKVQIFAEEFQQPIDPDEQMWNIEKYLLPDESDSDDYRYSDSSIKYWTPVRGRPRNVQVMSRTPPAIRASPSYSQSMQTSPRSPGARNIPIALAGPVRDSPSTSSPERSRLRSRTTSSPAQEPAFDKNGDFSREFVDSFNEGTKRQRRGELDNWLKSSERFDSFSNLSPQDPELFDFTPGIQASPGYFLSMQTSPRSPGARNIPIALAGPVRDSPSTSSPERSRLRSRTTSSPAQEPAFDDTGDFSGEFVDSFNEGTKRQRRRELDNWLNRGVHFDSFCNLPPQDPELFEFYLNPFPHELDGRAYYPRDYTPGSPDEESNARKHSFSLKCI